MAEENLIEEGMENRRRRELVRWAMESIEHINRNVLAYLTNKDATRSQLRSIIFDDDKLAEVVPALGIYREICVIHDKHKNDPLAFINEIKRRGEVIRGIDAELADKIGAVHFDDETASYLNRVYYSILMKIDDVRLFLRNIYPRLHREFSLLKNKQLLNKMEELFGKKTEEISYLRRYSREAANWNNLPEPQRVEYYTQRIRFFMYGGHGSYKGIVRDFNDREVLEAIKKKNVVRRLFNYSLERKFIADRIREIRVGLQQKDWADFLKFFKNVKKHARDLIMRFGNVDFANKILKNRKKFRKDPQSWLAALQEMEAQLSSRYFFESEVLKPATTELVAIFEGYAEKREKELDGSLKKFKDYVKGIINAIGKTPEKKVGEIMKLVHRKEEKIMSRWRRIRMDFEAMEIRLSTYMTNLENLVKEMTEKGPDPKEYLQRVSAIEDRYEQWRRYYIRIINSINVRRTGNLPATMELLSLPSILGRHDRIIKTRDDRLEETMIGTFSKIFPRIIEEAEKANEQLDRINAYISETGLVRLIQMKGKTGNIVTEEPGRVLRRAA